MCGQNGILVLFLTLEEMLSTFNCWDAVGRRPLAFWSPGGGPATSCLCRRLSKIMSESDPGTFQTTASALALGVSEVLCATFKSRVLVS